jgi:hypothetical protein
VVEQLLGATNGGNFDIALSRALTRLATVFVSFTREAAQVAAPRRVANTFQAPANTLATCESYLTVGSMRMPDFSAIGSRDHYWRTLKALGILGSLPHSCATQLTDYQNLSHMIGWDLERVPSVFSTGESMAAGQDLILHFRNYDTGAAANNTMRHAYVALHHERIIKIGASGVTLLT